MDRTITIEVLGDNMWVTTDEMNSVSYGLRHLNDDSNDIIARKRRMISCFEDYIMNYYECY